MDCLFCKIVKGEIPSKKVYEDSIAFAFLDINPCTPGHTMVIPKKHHITFISMTDEEVGHLFQAASKISRAVISAMDTNSFNMGFNNGKYAGQEINHAHIHIIPRYKDDGGAAVQFIVRTKPEREKLDEIAKKIKSNFEHEPKKEGKKDYDKFFDF